MELPHVGQGAGGPVVDQMVAGPSPILEGPEGLDGVVGVIRVHED